MEMQVDVLSSITNAKQLADGLAKAQPDGAPWSALFKLLDFYENKVRDHWPLTVEEKDACKLGWFSVKNIEETFPKLHAVLSDLAYSIRHSGE